MKEEEKTKRIAVLNNEIYEVSEGTYNIIQNFNRDIGHVMNENSEERHIANCNRIRKFGKKILTADIMLRDD